MILIVDDRPENILPLKSILELYDFAVDTASSGEEALAKALKNSYALIILDVQMPGMDGFEVADFLSGNNSTKDIPVIFLSAVNTEKKFITRGYSSGAIDYIVKPIDPDILLLKVKTFMRLYEQNRELNLAHQKLHTEVAYRKKAQQEMKEKASELDSVLDAIPQLAFRAAPNGEIEFVNRSWHKYAPSIKDFPRQHPDDEGLMHEWKKMLASEEPLELELRISELHIDDFRYHLLRVVPVRENGVIIKWVGTFTDIEEQKRSSQRKDEFVGIASHELKTPLTSIKGYLQMLGEFEMTAAETQKYASRALVQIGKLENLVNDLLDISKIENDKLKFELEPVDVEPLVVSILEIIREINNGVVLNRIGSADVKILGNPMRLEQVIINFISNAIKYSPKQVPIEIISRITDEGEFYFGVKDSGIGISPSDQQNIFNKFYRVPGVDIKTHGLGIGLYICAEILKKHNARYGVESEPGNGSLFYFAIPII